MEGWMDRAKTEGDNIKKIAVLLDVLLAIDLFKKRLQR